MRFTGHDEKKSQFITCCIQEMNQFGRYLFIGGRPIEKEWDELMVSEVTSIWIELFVLKTFETVMAHWCSFVNNMKRINNGCFIKKISDRYTKISKIILIYSFPESSHITTFDFLVTNIISFYKKRILQAFYFSLE